MTLWRRSLNLLTTPDIWSQTASNQYLHHSGRPYMGYVIKSFGNIRGNPSLHIVAKTMDKYAMR